MRVLRLLPLAFCTWLGCHMLAGLDSLTVGDEDDSSDSTGRGGGGAAVSATSVGGSATATSVGGMVGAGGMGGMGGTMPTTDCCVAHPSPGCMVNSTANSSSGSMMPCQYCVCMPMPNCCSVEWTQACADQANNNCPGPCGC